MLSLNGSSSKRLAVIFLDNLSALTWNNKLIERRFGCEFYTKTGCFDGVMSCLRSSWDSICLSFAGVVLTSWILR